MPFILNLETRKITEIFKTKPFIWISVIVEIKLLTEWHCVLEYEHKSIWGLYNNTDSIIVQTRDEAYDLEYATRECEKIKMRWGPPSPLIWPNFNLGRQNALSVEQWNSLALIV